MVKFLFSLLVIFAVLFGIFDYWVRSLETSNVGAKEFSIAGADSSSGRDSLFDIGENLQKEDVIGSKYYFYYYAWRYQLRGKMLAGTYIIPPGSSLAEMTHLFTKGVIKEEKPVEVSITFREGKTIEEFAQEVEAKGFPHEDFLALAQKPTPEILEDYDFLKKDQSLEGFLFPETHFFLKDATAEDIIRKYLSEFDKQVSQSMRDDIENQGKNLYDVIVLASIVEGEVTENIDRGLVAGVFQNRLDIDMPLQTDASIDYIKGIAEIKHTLEDLKIDSPYNTYLYPGLPPGPLNSPSLKSIIAAMNPTETEYFFFLNSNRDENRGETIFAETYDQHLRNKNANGL